MSAFQSSAIRRYFFVKVEEKKMTITKEKEMKKKTMNKKTMRDSEMESTS